MKTQWKKVVTREIPLFQIFYSNGGYVKLKKILGFGFGDSLVINKNGVIERYLEESGLQRFYNALRKLLERKKEKRFFKKAFRLDLEIKEIIKKLQKTDLRKLINQKLLAIFSDFDKKFFDYWTYYLAVFYLGDALDGTEYESKLKKYKKEIDILRGEKSARFVAEQNFAPKFFAEIGQRAKIKPSLLFFAFPKEVTAFLKNRTPISERKLRERKKYYVWLLKGNRANYYVGERAKQIVKKELREETVDYSKIKKLKGTVACRGRARGQVKVLVSSKDAPKMKKGNILVAPMTNPNYLPAMKKAAAFVTDEGGIMCHAAIVAREIKKPCIIGTKIATKVLKDGDLVEVDANKGIVRKIHPVK